GAVRRELGAPTLMNLIGPLANPASVRRQVVGVADPDRAGIVAEALVRLGAEHALVVHGRVGMDEISPHGITDVWEVKEGAVRQWEIDPQRFRLEITDVRDLQGGDPAANAERVERILGNGSAPADPAGLAAVLLNAGAAIYVAGIAGSLAEGIGRAREVVASAAPRQELVRHRDRLITRDRFDGCARSDQPEQRQLGGAGLALGRDDFDRPALVVRAPDVAFALEIGEVLVNRRERLEAKLACNFLEAGGVPLLFDVLSDVVQDLALAPRHRHIRS